MTDLENMNKCVFLDRDGVLNVERGDYTYALGDFQIIEGVKEALVKLKEAGYLLIVITNQAGIAKGLYDKGAVLACHEKLQKEIGGLIDDLYYSPYHPISTESLGRKPGSLLFEKAIAKYNINPFESWMVGDRERDLVPAKKLGMQTVLVGADSDAIPVDFCCDNLLASLPNILTS